MANHIGDNMFVRHLIANKWWEGFDIGTAVKECKKLNDENWELKQKISSLENYIKFKSLWEEFERYTK